MGVINSTVFQESETFEPPKWKFLRGRWWHWNRMCWASAFVEHLVEQGIISYNKES